MTALTIQKAKDQVAKKYNYDNWEHLLLHCGGVMVDSFMDEVIPLYAESKHLETCEAQKNLIKHEFRLAHPSVIKKIDNAPNVEFKP